MIQATKVNHVLIKGKRYYEIPGKTTLYPSTTTILSNLFVKPQLETWQRNTSLKDYHERLMKHSPVVNTEHGELKCLPDEKSMLSMLKESIQKPDQVKFSAASFGTRTHSLIEKIIKANFENIDCEPEFENVKHSFLKWKSWANEKNLEITDTELSVYSHVYKYAGTVDAVATMRMGNKNILAVLDWKTSNYISNEHALQVTAYAKAYEELYQTKVSEGIVVKLSKTSPSFQVKRVKDLSTAFKAFESAIYLYNIMNTDLYTK